MKRNNNRAQILVARNKRRGAIKAFRNTCCVVLFLAGVFFAGLKASAISTNAKGTSADGYDKVYKSVMVEKDDCLWDIAERNMGMGYADKRTYVEEIRQLNQLKGNDIHYGEYLCVPYYQ